MARAGSGSVVQQIELLFKDEPGRAPAGEQQTAAQVKLPNRAAPGRMLISGRVLQPQGKPMPNATVMAYVQRSLLAKQVIGQTQGDGSGLFWLDAPRTLSLLVERCE